MSTIRASSFACLLILISTTPACTPASDLDADRDTLAQFTPRWTELARAHDAAAIAAMFAEDGVFLRHGRAQMVGPESIEAFLAERFARNPAADDIIETERIDVAASGDLAFESGSWAYPATGREGRFVTVYRKEGGAWKVAADASFDTTPNGGAPDWAVELLATWHARRNAHNAPGLAALYTIDAVAGNARGRTAIESMFAAGWGPDGMTCTGSYDGFREIDNMAIGWGVDACTTPGVDGAEATVSRSNWLCFFERQDDGSWLISRDRGESTGS